MADALLHTEERDSDAGHHFPRGAQLTAIIAFWAVFAVISVANWLVPPSGQAPPVTLRGIGIGVFEAILWVVITPPLFWLTSRFSVERGRRMHTVALYLLIAVAIAATLDVLVELVRTHYSPPPPNRVGSPPRDRPFWGFARIRFLNDYMVVLAILAAGVARDYFSRYHRRLEESAQLRAQLAEARLTVLQSQLNPHFLFNTLNAVSALVDHDPKGVRRMIARLSELLRATLDPSADPEVPVSRELALIGRYLEILQIRFQGRLITNVDAAPSVQDALVPPLILQPLVENAMKHAVGRSTEPSRIDVCIVQRAEWLELSVEDTGAGSAGIASLAEPSTGIGLRNVRGRLEQIYGDAHELTLSPTPAGGTVVTIRLPYHTAADMRASVAPARA